MSALQLLTTSRRKAWRRCARYHFYRYELCIERIYREAALDLGTLVHAGLEAWWIAVSLGHVAEDVLAFALDVVSKHDDPFVVARASALLVGYHARWIGERDEWEVISVEQEFRAPLLNPATGAPSKTWRLAGKLDVRARYRGRHVVVEHKTTSEDTSPGSAYWQRLKLDSQVSAYVDGCTTLGEAPEAIVYDVLVKPGIEPHKATPIESRKYTKEKRDKAGNITEPSRLYSNQRERDETSAEFYQRLIDVIAEQPERFYQRAEVVRLDEEMANHRADVWAEGLAIRNAQRLKLAPKNPDGCMTYGKACQFLAVCCGEASIDDPYLYRRTENPHPELSEVARG